MIPLAPMVMPMVPLALQTVPMVPLVNQWYHWIPMVPLVKLPMVPLGEPQTKPLLLRFNTCLCSAVLYVMARPHGPSSVAEQLCLCWPEDRFS